MHEFYVALKALKHLKRNFLAGVLPEKVRRKYRLDKVPEIATRIEAGREVTTCHGFVMA